MAERLITVITTDRVPDLLASADDAAVKSRWEVRTADDRYETTLLVDVGDSEAVMDALHGRFEAQEDYRLVLTAVEASLPREDEEEEKDEEETGDQAVGGQAAEEQAAANKAATAPGEAPGPSESDQEEQEAKPKKPQRISREELYDDVKESATLSTRYLVMVVLATVVAAGGMMRDSVAVIIGAMVIAPLLGPNIALSLATTLADPKLARRSLITGVAGLGISLAVSLGLGAVLPVSLQIAEIASRAQVNFADIALALAAGAAGALSFTSGAPAGVIGVMVAVALLPPLVAAGLLAASGFIAAGTNALLLVGVNLICINLAGVLTFLLQGISPRDWREEQASKRATRVAIAIWLTLLVMLGAAIFLRGPIEL